MMMDIWSWLCELPDSAEWSESDSPQIFELASSSVKLAGNENSTRTIQLKAERTSGSDSVPLVTFSICLHGFHPNSATKTLWVSDTCPLNSEKSFLPLILQLLQEIITRSPTAHNSTCPRSQLQKLKPDPISWIMDSHSPESFSSFFNLMFLTRLFWLCVCDAPSEVGSLYFESLLGPNLEALSSEKGPVLRTFLVTVGVDAELCFMRTIGYMLTKWLILKQVVSGSGLRLLGPLLGQHVRFSYAVEAHGFWVLKGYAPILGMDVAKCSRNDKFPILEAKDSVLKYALAHQQLEAVLQLEYSVTYLDGHIRVIARVDNLRFHVVKLGFNKKDDVDYAEERHFVSRARVWVGPEVGATYVAGFSLGRSTDNGEKEMEMQKVRKGSFDEEAKSKSKAPTKVKTGAKMATKTRIKNWRWDQDAEGNSVIFDAVLYNNTNGYEVATWKMINGESNDGPRRPFTKTRGLVFAGDDYGEGVEWRISKEMEGSVLKWRIGGQVWVTYCPNQVKSSYFETRCVQWCDEVDLPLIPPK